MASKESQSLADILHYLRREGLSTYELALPVATLLLLRWIDLCESEMSSIPAFAEKEPLLPELRWSSFASLTMEQLRKLFSDVLPAAVNRIAYPSKVSIPLHHIGIGVRTLGNLSNSAMGALVEWASSVPFGEPADRISLLHAFDDVFLESRSSGWRFGQGPTPDCISKLMVGLISPKSHETIYDPCFGFGKLLTAACMEVRTNESSDEFSFCGNMRGVESNEGSFVVALLRCLLIGASDIQLQLGNSLEIGKDGDQFDVIIADPPFGLRVDVDRYDVPIRTSDITSLFIQHAFLRLKPSGRAALIVPESFLFRSGPDQRLRRFLLEQCRLDLIVSLPKNAFAPYTSIKTDMLVFTKGEVTKQVRMVDAEPFFEVGRGRQPATIDSMQLQELLAKAKSKEPSIDCWDVEAAELAAYEWDLTPRRRDRSPLKKILKSIEDKAEVVELKNYCRVLEGRAIKAADLSDTPPSIAKVPTPSPTERDEESPQKYVPAHKKQFLESLKRRAADEYEWHSGGRLIPYIRIRDIEKGEVKGGTSWIAPHALRLLSNDQRLRPGDILLSKSGTIGKVGIVCGNAVDGVASSGLYVLRPQGGLDAHFLLAYLSSPECRAFLAENTRGLTIQHLSKRVIEQLPLPYPSREIQRRVADQYRQTGVGDLCKLKEMFGGKQQDDPLSKWILFTLDHFKSYDSRDIRPLVSRQILDWSNQRNEIVHGDLDSELKFWFLSLSKAAEVLQNADEMPAGPAFFSLLEQAFHALHEAERQIPSSAVAAPVARELTRTMIERVSEAKVKLSQDVQVVVSSLTTTISQDKPTNVELDFNNAGSLPLRNVSFITKPDWGSGIVGYLGEHTSKRYSISSFAPSANEKVSIFVEWSGISLDGKRVSGGTEIAFDVCKEISSEPLSVELGGSPYVCGDPVGPQRSNVFFGRDELLNQIRTQISMAGNVVLLEGNRRSGKSSILYHLEGPNLVPGWLGVYCSLQGAEGAKDKQGVPTVEIFRCMAVSIAKALRRLKVEVPLPNGRMLGHGELGVSRACREGIKEETSFSDFEEYLEVVLEVLRTNDLKLLLMLDEFDKLQEGIDSGVTSAQVPENIRFLVQRFPEFSTILTGSRRLKRLREEYWSALYGLGTRFGVSCLPAMAARRLIIEPVRGKLTYSEEAVEEVIRLTARQPYLLQCMCNRVFSLADELKTRSITLEVVKQAAVALVEDNEHFASLWGYAITHLRRLLLTLCHQESSNPDPLTLSIIGEHLLKYGLEVSDDALIADLEFLRELELIDLVGQPTGGTYSLAIPLMGSWIDKQQDFSAVLRKAQLENGDRDE